MCSCGEALDLSHGSSYKVETILAQPGYCVQCGKGFCKNHYGTTLKLTYPRLVSPYPLLYGEISLCLECTNSYDDILEEEYEQKEEYAKSYEEWMWPLGKVSAMFIRSRNEKPEFRGSRSRI